MEIRKFRGMVGCLNYLTNTTRPDITFAMRALSGYAQNPGRNHWLQGKHVLRYLKATKCRKLTYKKSEKHELTGFSDANWAGKLDDRKFTSRFCFFLNSESGAISWSSKLQTTIATSTAEAEEMSLFAASQELVSTRNSKRKEDTEKPTTIHGDNQMMDVEFCSISEMIADLLTKPLAKVKVEMFSIKLSGEYNL